MKRRAVVVCPGRGSYTASELGYLSRPAPAAARARLETAIERSDGLRAAHGDLTIREIDAARKFKKVFFEGTNAAGVTFACTALDFLRLDAERFEIEAIGGNSMGWYSALFGAGALELEDTFDLVETMGGMTREGAIGGQLVYPVVDDEWRRAPERAATTRAALGAVHAAGYAAGMSIVYGGFAVLWVEGAGVDALEKSLPPVKLGTRKYPLSLPGHSAFHSPLMQSAAQRGLARLDGLRWSSPTIPMIDGRGFQWRPASTDPGALYTYTLQTQVVETFDFAATIRVALREYAPDCLVLLGPGDSLGGAVAHVLIAEKWQGIDGREAFLERQRSDPFVLSMARDEAALTDLDGLG